MPVGDRLRAVGLIPGLIRLCFQRNEDSVDGSNQFRAWWTSTVAVALESVPILVPIRCGLVGKLSVPVQGVVVLAKGFGRSFVLVSIQTPTME